MQYTKLIDCPEHPNGRAHWYSLRKHQAILFCEGGRYAGIWECPVTGSSDSHDHYEAADAGLAEIIVEDTEVDTLDGRGEHTTYPSSVYVCGGDQGCGIVLDGDPAADAAEDRADMDADNWRDE